METEATVSETMEDVLPGLGFKPRMTRYMGVVWENEEAGVEVRGENADKLVIVRMDRLRLGDVESLRAIVEAEQRCAAAWRGETEPDSKETDR